MLLYEVETRAAMPYKGWSNQKVWISVEGGYRLEKPESCTVALYALMMRCWERATSARPTFAEIVSELETLEPSVGLQPPSPTPASRRPAASNRAYDSRPAASAAEGCPHYEVPQPLVPGRSSIASQGQAQASSDGAAFASQPNAENAYLPLMNHTDRMIHAHDEIAAGPLSNSRTASTVAAVRKFALNPQGIDRDVQLSTAYDNQGCDGVTDLQYLEVDESRSTPTVPLHSEAVSEDLAIHLNGGHNTVTINPIYMASHRTSAASFVPGTMM